MLFRQFAVQHQSRCQDEHVDEAGRASNGSSALLQLLPLLGDAGRVPTILACIWRLSNCSRMCLHCAFGEDPKELHPVPGRCNPLVCSMYVHSNRKRDRRSRVATPVVLRGVLIFLVGLAMHSAKGLQFHCQVAYSRRSPNTREQTVPVVNCPSPLWLALGARQTAVRGRG